MIKKLDILIVRSFVGPFIVTFFVALFVLVMQFFWLYMDDLIGKGLGLWMILQLLFYMSTTMVPLALPLSILLASIMTFGSMGENFELVAIKSSGISLLRFMRPLFIFIAVVGGLAFVFNNNVIPVANLKALSLLYDLTNSKPTLNIRPDQFNNEIEGYSIRVGSKDKDGHTIHNVIIYDQSSGAGDDNIILADKGTMIPSGTNLVFRLQNGWRYEELNKNGTQSFDQMRMYFKSWDKVFDLSSFKLSRTNEDLFKGAYQMMNVAQLSKEIDSFRHTEKGVADNVSAYLSPYVTWLNVGEDKYRNFNGIRHNKLPATGQGAASAKKGTVDSKATNPLVAKMKSNKEAVFKYDSSLLKMIPDTLRDRVVQLALTNVRNIKGLLDVTANQKKTDTENYLKYEVEWHRKFTLSFACMLLFLIGAPLGAIIRKGGIGMPLVIAVAFFVLFHITSITGEKLAKTGTLPPWMGMWMATGMLLPIAFLLISQARNDSQIFSKEWYIRLWRIVKKVIIANKK